MKKRFLTLILSMMAFFLLSTSAFAMEAIGTNEIPTSVSTADIAPNKPLSQQDAVTVTYSWLFQSKNHPQILCLFPASIL